MSDKATPATDAEVASMRVLMEHSGGLSSNGVQSLIARIEQDGERLREMEKLLRDWLAGHQDWIEADLLALEWRTRDALKEAPDA